MNHFRLRPLVPFTLLSAVALLAFACGSEDTTGGTDDGAGGDSKNTGGSENTTSTGGHSSGGRSGGGGPIEKFLPFGKWQEVCDDDAMGGAGGVATCASNPWVLYLGDAALTGPKTFASYGGLCGAAEDEVFGTFLFNDSTLTLYNCASDGENAEAPVPRVANYHFSNLGQTLTIEDGDVTYTLERQTTPPTVVASQRLLYVNDTACDGGGIEYHVSGGEAEEWSETLSFTDTLRPMDEFFTDSVSVGDGGWGFYNADDRLANSGAFPFEVGTVISNYRITRAPDLTPTTAVGFIGACGDAVETMKAYEYDFVKDVVFRRYWDTSATALDGEKTFTVDGLADMTSEVLVTLSTSYDSDIAALKVTLVGPDETEVVLADGNNGDGTITDFVYTTFSDSAATHLDDAVSTYEGLVVPKNSLTAFVGKALNGTWKLRVEGSGEGGTISYFGLSLR